MMKTSCIAGFAGLLCISTLTTVAQTVFPPDTIAPDRYGSPIRDFQGQHQVDAQFIRSVPVRGLGPILSLVPGVVEQNGELHFRGGRSGEVRYLLNGHAVTNPFTNRQLFEPIPELLSDIGISTGVADSRFGRALSGQVSSWMKAGSGPLRILADVRTDELVRTGRTFLGTTSFGHRDAVLTFEGPAPFLSTTTFVFAARHLFMRNRQPRFVTSFSLQPSAYDPTNPFPGPLVIDQSTFANNAGEENTLEGNVEYEDGPLQVQLTGHAGWEHHTEGAGWPLRVDRFYNQRRNPELKTSTSFMGVHGQYHISPVTTLELRGSFAYTGTRTVDPDFGENWQQYTDSIANAGAGYGSFVDRWSAPAQYATAEGFRAMNAESPNTMFIKQSQSGWSGAVTLRHRLNDDMDISLGADMDRWTMRMFSVSRIGFLMQYLYGQHAGSTPRTFSSEVDRRWTLARVGRIDNYGYDVDGNEADTGPDAPYHPFFASAHVTHEWRHHAFAISSGIRYEYYNMATGTFRDPASPLLVQYTPGAEIIPGAQIVDAKTHHLFLPRLRASYSTDSGTSLSASVGSYAQMPPLDRILHSLPFLTLTISPSTRGNAYLTPVGLMAEPERSNHVEFAFGQDLGANLRVDLSSYMKKAWNLITIRKLAEQYMYYANEDEAKSLGFELSLSGDNGAGLRGRLSYALSDARGNGSHPGSSIGLVENPPQILSPPVLRLLEYNQTHRGTLFVDYHAGESAGPILEGAAFSLLVTFSSGHEYTEYRPKSEMGSAEPMMFGVNDIQDPRWTYGRESAGSHTTPAVFNVDLGIRKAVRIGGAELELYVVVLNLLDTKHVLNVYPTTGSASDDGFFGNPLTQAYQVGPGFEQLYRALNLENRWAYYRATESWYNRESLSSGGYDLYGSPRQLRFGVRIGFSGM
jgi:hypothetical protein